MKKLISIGMALVAMAGLLAVAPLANADNGHGPGHDNGKHNGEAKKLQCFSGTTDGGFNGTCTLSHNRKSVTLNTVDNDSDPNNAYAGVYVDPSPLSGKLLGDVSNLGFTYAAVGNTTASGGSPRLSIPIDQDNNGTWDSFAFIDTLGCNNGSANNGVLDATNDSTCTVAFGSASYPNWAAFASANPTFRIATNTVPFVIADQPGVWTISNVKLGRAKNDGEVDDD